MAFETAEMTMANTPERIHSFGSLVFVEDLIIDDFQMRYPDIWRYWQGARGSTLSGRLLRCARSPLSCLQSAALGYIPQFLIRSEGQGICFTYAALSGEEVGLSDIDVHD